jgi:hypothetical protein
MHLAVKERHREPRSGVAIHSEGPLDCFVGIRLLAMTTFVALIDLNAHRVFLPYRMRKWFRRASRNRKIKTSENSVWTMPR